MSASREACWLEREAARLLEARQRREFFLGQAEDLEEALAAANGGDVFGVDLDVDCRWRAARGRWWRGGGRAAWWRLRVSTCASMLPLTPTSRSVVVRRSWPSRAWSRTLERIGSVVRVLTTFWTVCNPARSFSLLTLNFIQGKGVDDESNHEWQRKTRNGRGVPRLDGSFWCFVLCSWFVVLRWRSFAAGREAKTEVPAGRMPAAPFPPTAEDGCVPRPVRSAASALELAVEVGDDLARLFRRI